MSGISPEQLAELERAVDSDPGASCFAVLAEVHRRAGRLSECERVVRQGLDCKPDARDAQVVLASVMLDQGRESDAREALERLTREILSSQGIGLAEALSPSAPPVVTDSEFEAAFDDVSTDEDEVIDPNRVAEEALDHVDRMNREGGADLVEPGGVFSTESMALLLERQGDIDGAERIRAELEGAKETPSADPPSNDDDRQGLIRTLESWLANLQRESR